LCFSFLMSVLPRTHMFIIFQAKISPFWRNNKTTTERCNPRAKKDWTDLFVWSNVESLKAEKAIDTCFEQDTTVMTPQIIVAKFAACLRLECVSSGQKWKSAKRMLVSGMLVSRMDLRRLSQETSEARRWMWQTLLENCSAMIQNVHHKQTQQQVKRTCPQCHGKGVQQMQVDNLHRILQQLTLRASNECLCECVASRASEDLKTSLASHRQCSKWL